MCFCCSIEITILFEFDTPEHFSMPKYSILWDWSCFIQTRHWLLRTFYFLIHFWKFKGQILHGPLFFEQSSNRPPGQLLSNVFLQSFHWSKTANSNRSSRIIFNLSFIQLLLQRTAAHSKRLSLWRTAMSYSPCFWKFRIPQSTCSASGQVGGEGGYVGGGGWREVLSRHLHPQC